MIPIFAFLVLGTFASGATQFKDFKSNYGFQVKVPGCFESQVQAPFMDDGIAVEDFSSPEFLPTSKCGELSNFIGFFVAVGPYDVSKDAALESKADCIAKKPSCWPNSKKNIHFEKLSSQNGAPTSLEITDLSGPSVKNKDLRWAMSLYCDTYRVTIRTQRKDVNPEMLKKIEAGENVLPEPFKTVFASLTCSTLKIVLKPTPSQKKTWDLSGVTISAPLSLQFLLEDSDGKLSGYDPVSKGTIDVLGHCSYGAEPGAPDTRGPSAPGGRVLTCAEKLKSGNYTLRIFPVKAGPYDILVRHSDTNGEINGIQKFNGTAVMGKVVEYKVVHSEKPLPQSK